MYAVAVVVLVDVVVAAALAKYYFQIFLFFFYFAFFKHMLSALPIFIFISASLTCFIAMRQRAAPVCYLHAFHRYNCFFYHFFFFATNAKRFMGWKIKMGKICFIWFFFHVLFCLVYRTLGEQFLPLFGHWFNWHACVWSLDSSIGWVITQ